MERNVSVMERDRDREKARLRAGAERAEALVELQTKASDILGVEVNRQT